MTDLVAFAGHLHPLLVHLPIGFLVLAGALALLARRERLAGVQAAVGPALTLGAAAAAGAALAGLLLGASGGYAGATFVWHRRLGVTLAVAAALTAWTWRRGARSPKGPFLSASRTLLAVTLGLLVVTAHLGGTLTHGEGYLTEHAPFLRFWGVDRGPRDAAQVRIYDDLVQPVLLSRCASCHGADGARGGLRLDSREGIAKGGESGAAFTAADPDRSELIRRIRLPSSHTDAMPPRGDAGLTVAESELLRWWIAQGAPFDETLADVEVPAHVLPIAESVAGPIAPRQPAVLRLEVAPADESAVRAVEALGVSVTPLAAETSLLSVHGTHLGDAFGDAQLQTVAAIGPQVTWLDLSGTGVSDRGLAALRRFPNLTRLHLDRTGITDAGLVHVATLERLEALNLYGTSITDAGLAHLSGLERLRSLYVWQTGASPAGVERLRTSNPRLEVEFGLSVADERTLPPGRPSAPR